LVFKKYFGENYLGVVLFIKIKIFAFDFISCKCIMNLEITNVNIEDATNSEPKDLKLIGDSLTKSRLSIVYRRTASDTPSTDEDVYICVYQGLKTKLSQTIDSGSGMYSKYSGNDDESSEQGYVQYKTSKADDPYGLDDVFKVRTMYYSANLHGESIDTRGARQYIEKCESDLAEVEGDAHDGIIRYTIIAFGASSNKIYDAKYVNIFRGVKDAYDGTAAANVNGLSVVSMYDHDEMDIIRDGKAKMSKGSRGLSNRRLSLQDKIDVLTSINLELIELLKQKLNVNF